MSNASVLHAPGCVLYPFNGKLLLFGRRILKWRAVCGSRVRRKPVTGAITLPRIGISSTGTNYLSEIRAPTTVRGNGDRTHRSLCTLEQFVAVEKVGRVAAASRGQLKCCRAGPRMQRYSAGAGTTALIVYILLLA